MAAWSRLPEGSKPIGGGPAPRGWSGRAFGSLRVPNYRLYAGAQLVSVTGTWMQIVAENWLVIRLTGSGLALGITTALQFMPLALAAPYGGLLVDRMNKRRLIAGTQTCAGLLALTTGLLTLFGLIRIWMVFVAALGLGFVNAVDDPAHQAFTQEMVGPGQVANAVALNDSISMGSRAFGPALAGILIATTVPARRGELRLPDVLDGWRVHARLSDRRGGSESHRPSRAPARGGLRGELGSHGICPDGRSRLRRRSPHGRGGKHVPLVLRRVAATGQRLALPWSGDGPLHRGLPGYRAARRPEHGVCRTGLRSAWGLRAGRHRVHTGASRRRCVEPQAWTLPEN